MDEEIENSLSLLGLKDFEERGIKTDQEWTGFDALVTVARVASEKLAEEERIKKNPVQSNRNSSIRLRNSDEFGRSSSGTSYKDNKDPNNRVSKTIERRIDDVLPKKRRLQSFVASSSKKLTGDAMKRRQRQFVQNVMRPDLPENFRARIEEMNGFRISLVIQKSLYSSDTDKGQTRLSIPLKQIVSTEFLTEDEKRNIDNNGAKLKVKLIDPSLQLWDLTFTRWHGEKGKLGSSYTLNGGWTPVQEKNKLEPGDTIQLWSFRTNNNPADELCLALVLLSKGTEEVLLDDNNNHNNGDEGDIAAGSSNGSNHQRQQE